MNDVASPPAPATFSRPAAPVPQQPRITGLNHVLFVCKDMNRTADFYVNVLGLKLKATTRQSMGSYAGREKQPGEDKVPTVNRLYFFETPDGCMVTFAELPDNDTRADHSFFKPNFWPGSWTPPSQPRKLDHIGFNVASMQELVWFRERLLQHGIPVSQIEDRVRYVKSIYFYDPDQIPLEIATWDYASPEWKEYKDGEHLRDPDLVPSLRQRG